MTIDFSIITIYELLSLILAIIAILIPIIQLAWKKWIVKAKLDYYPLKKAYLSCNKSGSYIRIDGVFEAQNKPISIKNIDVNITRKKDGKGLNLSWGTFFSPISQNFMGNYAFSDELAHPFRINGDNIYCAFIQFIDQYNSSEKYLNPFFEKLNTISKSLIKEQNNYTCALNNYKSRQEFIDARDALFRHLFWEIGEYFALIKVKYSNTVVNFKLNFNVSETDFAKIQSDIDEALILPLKQVYNIQQTFQLVDIEIK